MNSAIVRRITLGFVAALIIVPGISAFTYAQTVAKQELPAQKGSLEVTPATDRDKISKVGVKDTSDNATPEASDWKTSDTFHFAKNEGKPRNLPIISPEITEIYPAKKQQTTPSGWQFSFAPYLYATGITGRIGARGTTIEIDESFGDVLSNLNLGLMGTFEARKGKLIFVSDLIWTKMSVERDTPGDLFSSAKLGVNLFIFDPEVGYRVAESRAGSFDVLGGVRIWSVENNLNFRTGTLPGFDVSQRKTFAAPVIGVHGLLNLSSKFYLSSKFDIGGFGAGPDLTTQFYGGAGYRIKPNIALIGGYRYLMVDYDDSEGFLYDTTMNGFVFGAKFSF